MIYEYIIFIMVDKNLARVHLDLPGYNNKSILEHIQKKIIKNCENYKIFGE